MSTSLHLKAVELASRYRGLERELLSVLTEIRDRRIYLQQGYSSLFVYIVKGLNLSESTAYQLQTVIKKSQEVPELKAQVESGGISLCKAKRIAAVITKESAMEWLQIAKTMPVREIDRKVAEFNPKAVVERLTAKSAGRSELKIGVSREFEEKLKKVQDQLSNKWRRVVSRESALEAALDSLLEKFSARINGRVNVDNKTLTEKTKKSILLRDGFRCTHVNQRGERCEQTRFLEIHHLKPRSAGGNHDGMNLRTLCSSHHRFIHEP